MAERSFGQVATLRIDNPWAVGPQFYGLVLTDQRSIFVYTFTDKSVLGGAIGGAVGAAIAGAKQAKPREPSEYTALDPDVLASEKKNIIVEHDSVSRWELRKQMLDDVYNLLIEYVEEGKVRKLKAIVLDAATVGEKAAWSGAKRKETCLRNARAVQEAYRQALPASLWARFHGIG